MSEWTKADLVALDRKYAEAGIHPHQRPMLAASELLGKGFSVGMLSNFELAAITNAYRELFPELDQTWPGAGTGLIASVDQVHKFTLGVGYDPRHVTVWRGVGFESRDAWETWCRHDRDVAAETELAFADVHDFWSGINALDNKNSAATKLWHMAGSNLSDVSNVLPNTFSVDSVLQPICLTVELSLKASLTYLGSNLWGHDLPDLANNLAKLQPHRDDAVIKSTIEAFPNYVDSRYKPEGLNRYQVARLALAAQFIAASSVRRLSSVDLALAMERDSWPGPRGDYL